jgi:hypothetical protein
VAGRPLRPATDRRLGRPLPYQLANPTSAHPSTRGLATPAFPRRAYAVLANLSTGYSPSLGRFRSIAHPFAARQHVLLRLLPLDLHVLGTPPAFNLSQDQTLHLKIAIFNQRVSIGPSLDFLQSNFWTLGTRLMPPKDALTRVPTQITCKFLDSTSVAEGRRRGRNYRREPHSVNLCIQTLTTRRENRGDIRCVRARIIGSESGLSTRCNK